MYRSRRLRRKRRVAGTIVVLFIAAAATGGWWWWSAKEGAEAAKQANAAQQSPTPGAQAAAQSPDDGPDTPHESIDWTGGLKPTPPKPALAADERLVPEDGDTGPATPRVAAQPDAALETSQSPETTAHTASRSGNPRIEAARRCHAAGEIIEARHELNAMLTEKLTPLEQADVRGLLATIAEQTVFSRQQLPNDPLCDTHLIASGDTLINIGRQYDVPADVLMTINRISDPRRIRADQRIKVLRGPFNAKIYKSQFRLDVYLQDLYVRSFRVGLGANGATPEGVWRVKERLPNPTYYPPASATNKRIIAADDPQNPLGEHWIGLEGVQGEAVGQEGFGVHGTIEPESIGRAVSMGCVRLRSEDVAILYGMMQPGRSSVTILP
ncbi:MAG: L,D-transpeptidase family protein [Planctomycetes bacterium]|nr:L,D-transpeptidase family protein [Planctomycetota bacterium]